MKIKRILLTGDDGYNSIGIRLLIHFLKDKYDLFIAGTSAQQSGVGGKLNVLSGGKWGETQVDGVKAIWVDGTPADAIECLRSYTNKKFDLTISGINMGINISDLLTSGTVAAAWRSLKVNLSKRAMAVSWDAPERLYFHSHKGGEKLKSFYDHPGSTTEKIVKLALKNNFWGSNFLNINLPEKNSNQIRFTKFLPFISDYYPKNSLFRKKSKRYTYPHSGRLRPGFKGVMDYDAWAIDNGYITITPCQDDFLDEKIFARYQGKKLSLT